MDTYPLDDATSELMQETLQQWNAIRAFREGAAALFIRQQKLGPGNWHVADNQKELVRTQQTQIQPPKQPDPPSDLEQQLAASLNAAQDIKNVKRS